MKAAHAPDATRELLRNLWQRNLPVMKERVDELEQAGAAAGAGKLTVAARHSAGGTAHKLAGSLGMFGYMHGTEVARQMEQMLEAAGDLDSAILSALAAELRAELGL